MTTVLTVCTGNICRSPMAAALLRAQLEEDKRGDWEIQSAGIRAPEGRPASAYAMAEMEERGLDISDHRAQGVTEKLMRKADLVLAMTRHHAEALRAAFPRYADKVHLLSEMVGRRYDISDPYGGTRMEYAYIAQELEDLIEEGYERIVTLAETGGEAAE
jgi:protein-tyrosine-phosphatase